MFSVFEDFWRGLLRVRVAQHSVAVVQVAVQFHEADGRKSVKPNVGHGLHRRLKALSGNPLLQCLALARYGARESLPTNEYHLTLRDNGLDLCGGEAVVGSSGCHRLNKITTGLGSVGFELRTVHAIPLFEHG